MSNLRKWLSDHPDWILRTELTDNLTTNLELIDILEQHEFGYVTRQGEYFKRLRDVPNFIGIRQVIKLKQTYS